jgi:hypothetical protein
MTAERNAFAGANELLDIFASFLFIIDFAMKTMKCKGKAWVQIDAS